MYFEFDVSVVDFFDTVTHFQARLVGDRSDRNVLHIVSLIVEPEMETECLAWFLDHFYIVRCVCIHRLVVLYKQFDFARFARLLQQSNNLFICVIRNIDVLNSKQSVAITQTCILSGTALFYPVNIVTYFLLICVKRRRISKFEAPVFIFVFGKDKRRLSL